VEGVREIAYANGSALAIRRELFESFGRFAESSSSISKTPSSAGVRGWRAAGSSSNRRPTFVQPPRLTRKWLRAHRRETQGLRRVPDGELVRYLTPIIDPQMIDLPSVLRIANPLMRAYGAVARRVL
jgi:hypothetical protein